MRRSLAAVLAASALLSGCAGPEDRATDPTEASVEPDADPTTEPTEATSPASALSTAATAAVADLATTLEVDPSSVEVVSEEPVTWSDGSLGCAEKGMSYTQALVDGSRIVLRADGTDYEYHSGGSREPFLCPNPTE